MNPLRRVLSRTAIVVSSLFVVAAMAGLTWWALLVPPVPQDRVGAVSMPVAVTDVSYVCPAAPENTIGAVTVAQATESTTFTVLGAGAVGQDADAALEDGTLSLQSASGATVTVTPAGKDGSADAVGAVVVSSTSGDLRGLAAAPCRRPQASAWLVGGSGAVGSSSQLRLTNPGDTAVTARVRLYGSVGALTMPSGGVVAVPAGKTVALTLESSADGDDRLAVAVDADGGELVATLVTEQLDGETPAGVDMVTPGAGTDRHLIVPGVVLTEADQAAAASEDEGQATSSAAAVLRVVNPSAQEARVSVSLLGASGAQELPGADDLVIDPGAVADVSLAGIEPGSYAISVTASTPVAAAARIVRYGDVYPEPTGSTTSDSAWIQGQLTTAMARGAVALPHEALDGTLTGSLELANAADTAVTVELSTVTGQWSNEVSVPAHSTSSVALADLGLPSDARVLSIDAHDAGVVGAALVLTQDVAAATDTPAGTLVTVLPVSEDLALESSRSVVLK